MNEFNATEEQVLQIVANAINASVPMGMGFLHAKNKEYTPEDVKDSMDKKGNFHLDYYDGRMVKLVIHHLKDHVYATYEGEADIEYQSWAGKYPTHEDLVASVIN